MKPRRYPTDHDEANIVVEQHAADGCNVIAA